MAVSGSSLAWSSGQCQDLQDLEAAFFFECRGDRIPTAVLCFYRSSLRKRSPTPALVPSGTQPMSQSSHLRRFRAPERKAGFQTSTIRGLSLLLSIDLLMLTRPPLVITPDHSFVPESFLRRGLDLVLEIPSPIRLPTSPLPPNTTWECRAWNIKYIE